MMHKAWSSIEEVPYCFSRSYVKFQGHTALKIIEFDPNWAFPDSNSSLNSPMAMKCCTKLETAKERCPIVFQGHPSNFKVTRDKTSPILTQIGRFRIIGRSQLSNPSDLPCSVSIESQQVPGSLPTNFNFTEGVHPVPGFGTAVQSGITNFCQFSLQCLFFMMSLTLLGLPNHVLTMFRTNQWFAFLQGYFNSLRPRQKGRHFADDTFRRIFLNENLWTLLKNSLKIVPKVRINNSPALVQIMAWRRPGDKPLSEPMMISLPTHICVTRPQWVNGDLDFFLSLSVSFPF